MLRAQLLGGTPPELLGAITGLTEARFPVHAPSHFSDGFATVAASGTAPAGTPKTLVGTTIYSQQGAPVIAVQDGEIVGSAIPPRWGDTCRCATPTATPTPTRSSAAWPRCTRCSSRTTTPPSARGSPQAGSSSEPAPSGPASAGAQPRSPLSEGAAVSGLALGAAAGLEATPAPRR